MSDDLDPKLQAELRGHRDTCMDTIDVLTLSWVRGELTDEAFKDGQKAACKAFVKGIVDVLAGIIVRLLVADAIDKMIADD